MKLTTTYMAALCASGTMALPAVGQNAERSATNGSSTQQVSVATERSEQQLKVSEQEIDNTVADANKASKLIGMTVKHKQNETLGTIKDLAVDFRSGKIGYAVLSYSGVLGVGGKNVAVPIQALTLKPGEKALLIDLPKQELAQATGFDDKHWPTLDAAAKGMTIGLASSARSSENQGGSSGESLSSSGAGASAERNGSTASGNASSTNAAAGGSSTNSEAGGSASSGGGQGETNSVSGGTGNSTNAPAGGSTDPGENKAQR